MAKICENIYQVEHNLRVTPFKEAFFKAFITEVIIKLPVTQGIVSILNFWKTLMT